MSRYNEPHPALEPQPKIIDLSVSMPQALLVRTAVLLYQESISNALLLTGRHEPLTDTPFTASIIQDTRTLITYIDNKLLTHNDVKDAPHA
jgi:hypothetical protein